MNWFSFVSLVLMRLLAFTYSLLILVQSFNVNMGGITQLNAFIEHAQYHNEMYGDSLLDFIVDHYGASSLEHSQEHEGHDNLPFKDAKHLMASTHMSFLPTDIQFHLQPQLANQSTQNFFYKEPVTTFLQTVIFQPPKKA